MRLSLSLSSLLLLSLVSCSKTNPPARAVQVTNRQELVGGQRALGEIGDFKLSNGLVHAIIQNVGFSRGFGAFGGSLIDLDLVRSGQASSVTGVQGNDYFTEMFPAFFLLGIEPNKVEIVADGSDGAAAVIRVSGGGAEFISITKEINDLLIPARTKLAYTADYILEPGKQYLKIVVTITNTSNDEAQFPLDMPFGFVTLLGEGQHLFVPGEAGFDMRFHLEDVYKRPSELKALPGEVTSMITTEGAGVSYAVAASPRGASYMAGKSMYYPTAKADSMLIPVASSSFLGTFWGKPPPTLAPKNSYKYSGYVAVGAGDVASVQKVVYGIADEGERQPVATGTISGRVRENGTLQPMVGTSVVIQNEAGEYVSQARTIAGGIFSAPVVKGRYRAYAVDSSRTVTHSDYVDVDVGQTASVELSVDAPAVLRVTVKDELGRAVPAKISIEGIYEHTGDEQPRKFLYELALGERYRASDLLPDAADPQTRRYLERYFFAAKGTGGATIRPGAYTVFASRGPEYTLESQQVTLEANKTTDVSLVLTQVMKTPGWASGDFHVHSINSVDSDMKLDERVTSYAVEGVDLVTSTDHNFVSDFQPTIDALGLNDWLASSVGLELTTLEMGHFNAFPLLLDPGPISHGSFGWFRRPPGDLFAQLRGLGKDQAKTIVQVNHPRDSVLGYFNAFNVGTYTMQPYKPTSAFALDQTPSPDGGLSPYDPKNFSLDFDALEVFNGKREDLLQSYRIPANPPDGANPTWPACTAGKVAECIPAVGELTLEQPEKVDGSGTTLQPAYPGAIDDWFTMLGQGRHVTATGNSDSHGSSAEAGLPRTYMKVGPTADGSMRGFSEASAMEAVRQGHAFVTNGPFIELSINGHDIGETVVASDGTIEVKVKVQAAPWVDVTKVVIRRGGKDKLQPETLEVIDVPASTELVRLETSRTYQNVPDDSYVVVTVQGEKTMWPVFTPYEIPSIQISDAVSVIGGSFGFGNKWGKYKPVLAQTVKPFAFTNPIWVNRTLKQSLTQAKRILPVGASEPFHPRTIMDLRKIFGAFHADPSGE